MDDRRATRVSLLSGILSGGLFLLLFLILKWSFFVAAPLAILSWAGVYLLTKPVRKIGNTAIDDLDQGERLAEIYRDGQAALENLATGYQRIAQAQIAGKVWELHSVGKDIMNYLANHPQALSKSEHFIHYYMGSGNRILTNYLALKESGVSPDKLARVEDKVQESMTYLLDIFSRQRDSYQENTIMDLEAESELLEKTVKLSKGGKE
ncbi:5-bromo-4-chloroindolyl phosphate hydrolysis family protein [Kallipyga massiliensis]|uniref:5-bromo-4-chloroindolyl phosphate hydrolysis family protein n=1 Tax=Kallipyga massiliensis TaxID=1472764 RepID=UPI0026F02CA4|nr:5-bromo-4-chloroindolyl phosphate hydrolysis family protein [Kallipyga massiliensis]